MRLLLHACCAPCSVKCAEALRGEGITPALFWYNPNIHPFTEYENRRQGLYVFAEAAGLEAVWEEGFYGLRPFLTAVGPDFAVRCEVCYGTRLAAAARYAVTHGYDGFSTTLLISPYQEHDRLRAIGEQAARDFGIQFVYRDFRPWFRAGQQSAREMGLYRQKYCGCIFSEEERFCDE